VQETENLRSNKGKVCQMKTTHKIKSGKSLRKSPPKSKARVKPARLKYGKVLVPVDFSESSQQAFRYAVRFAAMHKSRLLVLYVVEPMIHPPELGYPSVAMSPLPQNYRNASIAKLKELCDRNVPRTLKVSLKIRVGRAYQEIVTAASDESADLIIISTHGYTGLKHALLGSTAERVVRQAGCPVLTVRTAD